MNAKLKQNLFRLVDARLKKRADSLILFHRHWKGRASGIEGWFKLEFVAAIGPEIDHNIASGGSGGHGHAGRKCCDLVLTFPTHKPVDVELKAAGSNWYYGGNNSAMRYKGNLLAFLTLSESPIRAAHKVKVLELDPALQLSCICKVNDDKHAYYFGMVDLTVDE